MSYPPYFHPDDYQQYYYPQPDIYHHLPRYPPTLYDPYISYPLPEPDNDNLILLDQPSRPDVKEEPSTPNSPQFIFEFPGGDPEDDPPPLDLPPPVDPLTDDIPCPRPSSPATEGMKSMMSVFRVDPFASYDAHPGTSRRRRRKRPSTYAQLADPEASSRQPPLIFTFQLDLGPAWPFDNPDDDQPLPADDDPIPFTSAPPPFDQSFLLLDSASTSSLDASLTYPLSDSRRSSPSSPPLLPSPRRAKTHVCWICQKEFPRPSGLATHMHTHSGAKPFRCPVPTCAKPFAVRSNARRHLRTHTEYDLATAIPGPPALASSTSPSSSPSPSPPPFGLDDVKCEAFAAAAFQNGAWYDWTAHRRRMLTVLHSIHSPRQSTFPLAS